MSVNKRVVMAHLTRLLLGVGTLGIAAFAMRQTGLFLGSFISDQSSLFEKVSAVVIFPTIALVCVLVCGRIVINNVVWMLYREAPKPEVSRSDSKAIDEVLEAGDAYRAAGGQACTAKLWVQATSQTDDIQSAKRLFLWLLGNSNKGE